MNFKEQLAIYLKARFTLIVVVTQEEERVLECVKAVCEQTNRLGISWEISERTFQEFTDSGAKLSSAPDGFTALEQIDKIEHDAIFVLKDFHDFWKEPHIKRKLRTIAQKLRYTKKSLVITTPTAKIPDELKDEAIIIDFPPPDVAELETVLEQLVKNSGIKMNLTQLGKEKLVQAALGLTAAQARRVFSKVIVSHKRLDESDIAEVMEEKKQIIKESEALEFFAVTETPEVGGLEELKRWLNLRERAFSHKAQEYGLPAPKGIALIGIPGTGKSLTAKMIGGLWRLPLLRLDVGALFGSLVGESEERTRKALLLAETIAPCILWIDEMEKALAHGDLDGGASTRVFGTILTWMQEKTSPCFVVATANDTERVPPELLRKGRFDEIFFLDLPTFQERQEIFEVHLNKRRRLPQDFDLERLAREANGYVGSEIEQAIIDAMYIGFNDGERKITTEDIAFALKQQVPLSKSHSNRIQELRAWLKEGRARSASFQEIRDAEQQFVKLEVDE